MLVMQSACGGANSFSASNSKPTAIKSNVSEGTIEDRNPEGHVDSDAFSEQVGVEDTGTIESTSSVSIGCDQYTEKTKIKIKPMDENRHLSISGEICPDPLTQNPDILFMVDASGSMNEHRNSLFGPLIKGSDPLVDGSCGRFQAIKSIISKATGGLATQDGNAGLLLFSSELNQNSIKFTSMQEFEAKLTPERVCIADGTTNYEQAFITAQKWLSAASSDLKIAYFISDGMPTESNSFVGNFFPQAIISRSITAGQRLLFLEDQLQFFQIFLGEPNKQNIALMREIAGGDSENKIRSVAKSSELAEAIAEFSIINVTPEHLSLSLAGSPVSIKKVEETKKGAKPKWKWEAEIVILPDSLNQFDLVFEFAHPKIQESTPVVMDISISP